jgi:hypothetical protein
MLLDTNLLDTVECQIRNLLDSVEYSYNDGDFYLIVSKRSRKCADNVHKFSLRFGDRDCQ